jgi:hypothetical protein
MGVILVKLHHVNVRANHFLKPKQKQKNDKQFAHIIVWHRWISLFQETPLAWGLCFIPFPKITETIYEAESITGLFDYVTHEMYPIIAFQFMLMLSTQMG